MRKKAAEFINAHKTAFTACALAICTAVVLAVFYVCFMPVAFGKMQSEYISDNYSVPTGEIKRTQQLTQQFTYDKQIYAMGFVIDSLNSTSGGVNLEIFDSESNLLSEGVNYNVTEMQSGKYTVIKLDRPAKAENGQYTAVITVDTENGALLYKSEADVLKASLTENGVKKSGTLAMLASFSVISNLFVNMFFMFLALCALAVVLLVYYAFFIKKLSIEKLFVVCLISLAVLYNIILPPYSSPDEVFHINEAYRVSNTILGMPDTRLDTTSYRAQDKNPQIEDHKTNLHTYKAFAENTFISGDNSILKEERTLVGGLKALYWPAGIGVAIARIFNMGFVQLLYFGRLANLIIYAICGYFAVKAIPFAKNLLFTVLLLPISIHIGFSFSRDSIILSLSTLFICLCLECAAKKNIIGWRRALILLVCSLIIASAKSGVYLPICLLVLIIPKECFKNIKFNIGFKAALLLICTIFLYSTTLDIAIKNAKRGAPADASPQQIAVNALTPNTDTGAEAPAVSSVDKSTFSIKYMLSHKKQTVQIVLNSLTQNTDFYLQSMVGGSLGYFSLNINNIFVYALWFLLIIFAVNGPKAQLRPQTRAVGVFIFFAVAALVVAGCVVWTPVFYTTIYGIQGRYFLPALLLLGMAFQSKKLQIDEGLEKALLFSIVPINLLVLFNAFSIIITR